MPTFDTPEPITAVLEVYVGDVRVTASDRPDTVVQVVPRNPASPQDVQVAEQTQVNYSGGRLLVRTPKPSWLRQVTTGAMRKEGSVDLLVELPTGSRVEADGTAVSYHGTGTLGEVRAKTSAGTIRLEHTGALDLHSGAGHIEVDQADGGVDISTGSGRVRLGRVDGSAAVKNSNGDCWVGGVAGEARVSTANGEIVIDSAAGDVNARTANGEIRIGELVRGTASLKTGYGDLTVGIRQGTVARLDMYTSFGRTYNQLESTGGPTGDEQIVDVSARTSYGDIVLRRSSNPAQQKEEA